jgi:RND family efflux transporter MFP subunit
MKYLATVFRILLPLAILGGCGAIVWWLVNHPPEQKKAELPVSLVQVDGTVLHKGSYDLKVRSQGTVQPRTRSTLLPEVSGRIIEISASFRPGGFFEKDEVLMKLDPVDYETAIVVAKAALAQTEVVLAEETAKAEQARENWRALGRSGEPTGLATRAPQLAKAQADAAAAKAQVLKAERDLQRTVIRAPYQGQVLEQMADVGQYVTTGTVLGRIFAVDYVEIRLPLPERESQYLTLPQPFRGQSTPETGASVSLKATLAGKTVRWQGRVVRVEGALDAETRQATAVVQVDDPYGRKTDGAPPLTIGAFVEAEISGDPLQDVFIIPRNAVRAGNEIILINRPQNTLRRLSVEPMVSNEKHIVVAAGSPKAPKEGDVLCLTPIPFPADGARVKPRIDGVTDAPPISKESAPTEKKPPVVSQSGSP